MYAHNTGDATMKITLPFKGSETMRDVLARVELIRTMYAEHFSIGKNQISYGSDYINVSFEVGVKCN
ncbi:hypothetical protein [Edwardsiella phage MSW-3]|uniref:Uncharacterized protein n=1 Tax=Edwardsiella phage MSW-3 TaxID=1264700 RepID=L0MZ40_9CAUD|nr:hypothetical protein G428_gp54 [Edwardsiella phage MSW-3]BAM68875.1 hypothetical protein [Edwardsiella phage MSW-3]